MNHDGRAMPCGSDECGAPIVSICGGEPMIYPEIGKLAKEFWIAGPIYILARTSWSSGNGLRIQANFELFFKTSLGRARETHDLCVERDGVFREPFEALRPQGCGIPGLLQYHDLTRDGPDELRLYSYLDSWESMDTCSRRRMAIGGSDDGHLHDARGYSCEIHRPFLSWTNTI